jgi:hypothetical protein
LGLAVKNPVVLLRLLRLFGVPITFDVFFNR